MKNRLGGHLNLLQPLQRKVGSLTIVEQAAIAGSTLMGDVVEPRREFIQANALEVANLDV